MGNFFCKISQKTVKISSLCQYILKIAQFFLQPLQKKTVKICFMFQHETAQFFLQNLPKKCENFFTVSIHIENCTIFSATTPKKTVKIFFMFQHETAQFFLQNLP